MRSRFRGGVRQKFRAKCGEAASRRSEASCSASLKIYYREGESVPDGFLQSDVKTAELGRMSLGSLKKAVSVQS